MRLCATVLSTSQPGCWVRPGLERFGTCVYPSTGFGFVQLCYDTHAKQEVAIKFVERGAGITKNVVREILNHRLCSLHPHIVQFKEVSSTSRAVGIPLRDASHAGSCAARVAGLQF